MNIGLKTVKIKFRKNEDFNIRYAKYKLDFKEFRRYKKYIRKTGIFLAY